MVFSEGSVFREVYVDSTRAASVGLGQQDNKKANIYFVYICMLYHTRLSKREARRQKRMKESFCGVITEMKTKQEKKL